ncbi:MAG: sensor domain-containing protein [Methylocystis sp.]|jgi:diguanylate cyclase (GGDEF)-like protein/PAS domain S-box-containing protein
MTTISDVSLTQEVERLRAEVDALRLANAAIQEELSVGAAQTDKMLRVMEQQAEALQAANRRQTAQADFTQRVMDTSSALMIVLGPEGRIRQVNGRFAAELRAPEGEITERVLDEWLPPEEKGRLEESLVRLPWKAHSPLFEQVRRSGAYRAEHRLLGRDGGYRFYWLEATLQHDPRGKEEGAVVCATDITAIKSQRDALLMSERQLKEAQRIAQIGRWELDLESDRVHWSEELLQICGLNEPPCGYHDCLAIIHPDDRQAIDEAFQASIRDRRLFSRDCRLILANGETKWVEVRGLTHYREDGQPLRANGTLQDVTAQRLAAEQLSLAASVFDSSLNGVTITDAEARIIKVNPAFSRILGYSAEEVVGKKPGIFKSKQHDVAFYQNLWTKLHSEGEWQGEIWDRRKDGEIIPLWQSISVVRDAHDRIRYFIGVFYDLTEQKRSAAHIHHLAYYDSLTDLPNRQLFKDRCDQAMKMSQRTGKKLCLLFLDLDRFKYVNDSLGHPVGDELLRAVARRLSQCLRRSDTIARLGGDEFIVLLQNTNGPEDAARAARKILTALARPFIIQGHRLEVRTSIGVSCYPGDGENATTLIKNADLAMYQAKEEGRDRFIFYQAHLTDRANERLFLEGELRKAMQRGELFLHYQPQFDLADGRLVGSEALLRWRHPERGMIPPDKFISIAEDTGLIIPLGEWTLREACRQAMEWACKGLGLHSIAVNISGVQIERSDLVQSVAAILAQTGLPPQFLELEITETYVMRQAQHNVQVLDGLRALGVSLAIDDFGTGQSSLAYLKRLPVDKLKIDRSFIADLPSEENEAAIARAIVALGHSLHLKVLAEGIETPAQAQFLRELGCDEAQGYLFSRPIDAASMENILSEHGKQSKLIELWTEMEQEDSGRVLRRA